MDAISFRPALVRMSAAPPQTVDAATAADALFGRGDLVAPRSTHCLWATDVGGPLHDSPAVGPGGHVFVASQDVVALDGLRGQKLWRFDAGASRGYSPEVGAGTIQGAYVGTRNGDAGRVFAVSADADPASPADDEGIHQPKVAWTFDTAAFVTEAPRERDGRVFVPCKDRLYALDARTGEKLWDFETPKGRLHSFTVGDDGHVYIRTGSDVTNDRDNGLYALDVVGGDELRLPRGTPMPQPACREQVHLSDGTTFRLGMDDNGVYAYDAQAQKTWEYQTGGEVLARPAVGPHDIAYVGSCDHKVYALAADAAALVSRLARDAAQKRLDAGRPAPEPKEIVKQDDFVVINGVRVPRRLQAVSGSALSSQLTADG